MSMRIADAFVYSCYRYPEKKAFIDDRGSIVYGKLWKQSMCLAQALQEKCGVRPGDHVGVFSCNRIEAIELLFAANYIGAVIELYNALWAPAVVAELACEGNVKALFAELRDKCDLEPIRQAGLPLYIMGGDAARRNSFEALIASVPGNPRPYDQASSDDVAIDFFTSGTTSKPKCVEHTNANVMMQGFTSATALDWERDDVLLLTYPFYHVAGFVPMLNSVMSAATAIIAKATKACDIARIVHAFHVTRGGFVPVVIQRLLHEAQDRPEIDLTSLRVISYGSSPVSPDLLARCRKTIGCKFNQGYGMTESLGMATLLNDADHQDNSLLHTVGKPVLGASICVAREDGSLCAPDEDGEILMRSYSIMKGYRNKPELNARALAGGWLHTDDIGFLDERGYLHIKGRKGGMIISGGENIYPQEVQDCIFSMGPEVLDAFVIGVPDAKWGQTLAAFIVADQAARLDRDVVRTYCRNKLGAYKRPSYVYFVDTLPHNGTGKVDRQELRRMHDRACRTAVMC